MLLQVIFPRPLSTSNMTEIVFIIMNELDQVSQKNNVSENLKRKYTLKSMIKYH